MKLLPLSVALLLLAACGRDMSSRTYTDSQGSGTALEGVVVSVREVTIKGHDTLQNNSAGLLAGGATGAVAGNAVGKGAGHTAATVGGALAGAVLGAVIEDQLSSSDGMEYIVKVNNANLDTKPTRRSEITHKRDSASSDVTVHTEMKTQLVTVVQARDELFAKGQKVYVIYSGDRPHLVAR